MQRRNSSIESIQCGQPVLVGLWLLFAIIAGCLDAAFSRIDVPARGDSPDVGVAADRLLEPYRIEVTGRDYRWYVRYPDALGRIQTELAALPLRQLHVPAGADIVFVLKSLDYVYVLDLPDFRKKEIAVPTLEFRMQFRPETLGRFALVGDELCGDPHPELKGTLIVEPQAQFFDWLGRQRSRTAIDAAN